MLIVPLFLRRTGGREYRSIGNPEGPGLDTDGADDFAVGGSSPRNLPRTRRHIGDASLTRRVGLGGFETRKPVRHIEGGGELVGLVGAQLDALCADALAIVA